MILKGPVFLKKKKRLIQEKVKGQNSKWQEKRKRNHKMKETLNQKFGDMRKSGEMKNIKKMIMEIEENHLSVKKQ